MTMNQTHSGQHGRTSARVLRFASRYWRQQPWRMSAIILLVLLSAPGRRGDPRLFAGRLIDAVADSTPGADTARRRHSARSYCW